MDCVYFWWIHFGFLIYLFYILFFPSFSFPAQPPDDSQHNLHLLSGGSGLVREGNQRKKNESKLRTHHEKYDLQSWFFVSHKFLDSSFFVPTFIYWNFTVYLTFIRDLILSSCVLFLLFLPLYQPSLLPLSNCIYLVPVFPSLGPLFSYQNHYRRFSVSQPWFG